MSIESCKNAIDVFKQNKNKDTISARINAFGKKFVWEHIGAELEKLGYKYDDFIENSRPFLGEDHEP